MPEGLLRCSPEVAAALAEGRPLVALETSIVGQGLPPPYNLEAARRCEGAVRGAGAVPATTAVIDGALRVGLSEAELESVGAPGASRKVSVRDLSQAVVAGTLGATTVAATLRAAGLAGIRVMATGGIGGVHLGHPEDVSADLTELATTACAVFCAGPKSVLDVARTLEMLETLQVPVLGWQTDALPVFYRRASEFQVPRVEGPAEAAAVLRAHWAMGGKGVVLAVPPPGEVDDIDALSARAAAELADVTGPSVTPRMLARLAELSGGRTLRLNVDLVVNNARQAAETAVWLAARAG